MFTVELNLNSVFDGWKIILDRIQGRKRREKKAGDTRKPRDLARVGPEMSFRSIILADGALVFTPRCDDRLEPV